MVRTVEITPHQQRVIACYARHEMSRDEAAEMLQVSTKTVLRWFKRLGFEYEVRESQSKAARGHRLSLARAGVRGLDRDNVIESLMYLGDEQRAVADRFGLTVVTVRKFTRAYFGALLHPVADLPKSEWKVEDWAQHAVLRLAEKHPDVHAAVVELAKCEARE